MSKQLLTTAPARAGSHHPLRRAKRVHHPICNIYPLITFHFLWKTLLENREHFHTIKCTQRGVKRYNTKNTQMMRAETPMLQNGKAQHYPWLVKFTTRLLRKISKTNNTGASQFVGGWPWTECWLTWILYACEMIYALKAEVALLWQDQVHKYLFSLNHDPVLEEF